MATVIIKDNTREGKWLLNLIKGHKSVTVVESNDTAFEMPSGREMTINPSPSGDPFWNNPHNVEELKEDWKIITQADQKLLRIMPRSLKSGLAYEIL